MGNIHWEISCQNGHLENRETDGKSKGTLEFREADVSRSGLYKIVCTGIVF
jgi:hypothetical protein